MLGKILLLCATNITAMLLLISIGEETKEIIKEDKRQEEEENARKLREIFREAMENNDDE